MLATLVASIALSGQGSVTLIYRPPLNKPVRYQMVMDTTQDMGPAGKKSFKTQMTLEMKAVSRKGDVTTIQSTILGVKILNAPKSEGDVMDSPYKSMVGKKTTMMMDSHFRMVSMESSGMGGAMAQGMASSVQGFEFPKKPVRIGDSWTSQLDIGKMLSGAMKATNVSGKIPIVLKLIGIQGRYANISMVMKGTVSMDMNGTKISTTLNTQGLNSVEISDGVAGEMSSTTTSTTTAAGHSFKQFVKQSMHPIG